MFLFSGKRRSGKTKILVEEAKAREAIVVVPSEMMAYRLRKTYPGVEFMPIAQLARSGLPSGKRIVIDELELCLKALIGNYSIEGISICQGDNNEYNPERVVESISPPRS